MDFTRQPIIETVITAKEGFKLVVRSSKSSGIEEYFVDAVEMVSFGGTFFFRSTEKPKPFLLPATDYEVLEVREARMVLKNVGIDKSIKIGGGKEESKPSVEEKKESVKSEKRREKRKSVRRRKERGQEALAESKEAAASSETKKEDFSPEQAKSLGEHVVQENIDISKKPRNLVPPPTALISETLEREYKGNDLYKSAFYEKEKPVSQEAFEEETAESTDSAGISSDLLVDSVEEVRETDNSFFEQSSVSNEEQMLPSFEIEHAPIFPDDELTS